MEASELDRCYLQLIADFSGRILVRPMRLPFVLLVVASALVSEADANDTYSTVVLAGAATEAGDGFYIRIDPDRATEKTPKGSPYAAVTFDAYVPRVVGKTDLGSVYLEVVGRDGRTLAQVALEPQNSKDRPPNYYVFADRRFAADCALHFQYNARPFGSVAKDYVVRLKYHLPPKR